MTDFENTECKESTDKRTLIKQFKNIIQELVLRRKTSFSQQEVADFLEVDRRKIMALENNECYDIQLLEDYAGLMGKEFLLIDSDLIK